MKSFSVDPPVFVSGCFTGVSATLAYFRYFLLAAFFFLLALWIVVYCKEASQHV